MLAALTNDHAPLLFSLDLCKDEKRDEVLWKFNNSLTMNYDFVTKMKFYITSTLETLQKEEITDFQARWEFLK